jgi:hypothetical protein
MDRFTVSCIMAGLFVILVIAACSMPEQKPADPTPPVMANLCITVVSPFVEDPIIIPGTLSDNTLLCAPKKDLEQITEECVSLFLVRRYLYQQAALKAER